MNYAYPLHADIPNLVSGTGLDLLNCLLLIRYQCAAAAMEQPCQGAAEGHACEDLWHKIAAAAEREDGRILPVIRAAMGRIKPELPFMPELFRRPNDLGVVDERAWRLLVRQLDSLPIADLLPSDDRSAPKEDVLPLSGDCYTPAAVALWMTELLEMESGKSVYDPYCGSGSMLFGAALAHPGKQLQLYGQAPDPKSFFISKMKLRLQGLSADLGPQPANPLQTDLQGGRFFDYILTNPPFNFSHWYETGAVARDARWQYGLPPRKNANFAWLQHILSHLSPGGRAVTLLPNGTLTTQNLAEQEIRRSMLLDGWVEAILALPAGLFHGTRIPCCAWFLNRDVQRDTVLFVDARQKDLSGQKDSRAIFALFQRYRAGEALEATEWYAAATLAEITEKNCILSPNLYTQPKALSLPPLRQLSAAFSAAADALCAQIPSPALCLEIRSWKDAALPGDWASWNLLDLYSPAGGVFAAKECFGTGTPMADVKTVIQHMFLPDVLPARVQLPNGREHKYDLRAGDSLLNRTSETVDALACCCAVRKDCGAVYGAFLKRLRPRQAGQIDPRYAAAYFRSKIYRREVQRVSVVHTTRANMNLAQLAMIRFYEPGASWQRAIGQTLDAVIRFGQTHPGEALDTAIRHFVEAFLELFITYPISVDQKERAQR